MTELVRTYKLTDSGAWGWVTEEAEGGGGGSLPSWWTVDSTPGSETATFAGALNIAPTGSDHNPLDVIIPEGSSKRIFFETFEGAAHRWEGLGSGEMRYRIYNVDGDKLYEVEGSGAVTISPSDDSVVGLKVTAADGTTGDFVQLWDEDEFGINVSGISTYIAAKSSVQLAVGDDFDTIFTATSDAGTMKMRFFGGTPAAKPTGVAVTAGGIHAALVTLGLIAA